MAEEDEKLHHAFKMVDNDREYLICSRRANGCKITDVILWAAFCFSFALVNDLSMHILSISSPKNPDYCS